MKKVFISVYSNFQDECKEEEVVVNSTTTGALPPDHENYSKWFYRDPQGDLQGMTLLFIYLTTKET